MNPLIYLRLLLAHRGHRRYSENAGFVMPLVILIGITLTVVGFAMMQRASSQKNDATSKEATAKALSAAEAGVTQFTNLMNIPANRFISTLPDCQFVSSTDTTCSSTTDTTKPNWQNIGNMSVWVADVAGGGTSTDVCNSIPSGNVTTIQSTADRAWKTLPGGGEYRLVSYQYERSTADMDTDGDGTADAGSPLVGQAPGTGILTVEGQVDNATARVEVRIPITPGLPDWVAMPGLWVKEPVSSSNDTILGGNGIAGDVLVNACEADLTSVNLTDSSYEVSYTTIQRPELPDNPATNDPDNTADTTTVDLSATTPPWTADRTVCPNNLNTVNSSMLLPERNTDNVYTDEKTTVKRNDGTTVDAYEYCVNSITLGGNEVVTIETVDTRTTVNGVTNPDYGNSFMVILHLQGNIDIGGTADIKHSCPATTHPTLCDGVGDQYKNTDLNIFGYSQASNAKICLSGNSYLDAFILAPEYTFGVGGGGGTGGVYGSVIVNNGSVGGGCGSNTSNTVISQVDTWDDMAFDIQPQATAPYLNSASGWSTKAVN